MVFIATLDVTSFLGHAVIIYLGYFLWYTVMKFVILVANAFQVKFI